MMLPSPESHNILGLRAGGQLDAKGAAVACELKASMLHQDRSLLIFNKPAGLATQGGNNIRHSLDSIAAHAFKSQTGEPPRWELPDEPVGALTALGYQGSDSGREVAVLLCSLLGRAASCIRHDGAAVHATGKHARRTLLCASGCAIAWTVRPLEPSAWPARLRLLPGSAQPLQKRPADRLTQVQSQA